MHALLVTVLAWFGRYLVARFALAFGIFTVSSVVINQFFTALQNAVNAQLDSLTGAFATAMAVSGLPVAVNIIFSAYAAAIVIKQMKGFQAT